MLAVSVVLRRRLPGLIVVAAALLLTNCSLDELVSPSPTGALTVAPLALVDSARVGSTAARTQTVTLGIQGPSSAIAFGVAAELGSSWIVDGLGVGTAPNDWTIGLDPAGLSVGEYLDTLRVTSDGPDARLIRVPVRFRILPCEVSDLGALPGAVLGELTTEDCASTSQTDRFAKRFQFTGAVDDSVTVRVLATDFTPRVTLRRTGAMSPLGLADSCPATGAGACTRYLRLPEAGTYEVEVTSTTPGATGDFELRVAPPRAPAPPATLSQRTSTDLTQVIAPGATLGTDRIALQASLSDADLDSLHLEIELRPIATPFTGAPTATSALLPGPTFTQTVVGLTDNTMYRWQARAVDVTGRASAWVAFGDGTADFAIGVPDAPAAPATLIQRKVDGETPVALGATTDEAIIRLGATLNDPDPADQIRLELEVRPLGTAFTNVATQSSAPQAPGTSILVSVAGLVDNGQYRWQSRAVDQTGRTSAWTPFGGASTHFRVALTPTQLSFITGPSTAAAGAAITPSVRVAVRGAGGSTLASYTGPVTLALDNAGGATLGGTTTVNAVAGVATFTDLSVDRAGTGYTLTATAGSLDKTSAAFDVTPAAAANMLLSAVPTTVVAGATLAPALTVTVRDALGNVASGFTGTVSLALAANADDAVLLGTTSVAAVAGVATFSDLRVARASSALTIVATATGLANVSSTPFAVTAAEAVELVLVTEPATAAASGLALSPQPVLELRDEFGNPVLTAGTAVTATIASGPGGSSLVGASVNTASDGRATFTALAIVGASGSYTLVFDAGALSAVPAAATTVGAGVATQLTLSVAPPATAVNGVPFGTEVRARLRDAAGNPVLQAGVSVAVSVASGAGTLTGTTTVLTNTMGQAIFSDLGLLGVVGGRTLAFSSSGLTGVTSGTVSLVAGAATTLALQAGDGQTAAAAAAVAVPPAVIATDVSGNPVAGVSVTFAVTGGGGAVVPPGPVVTAADGVAEVTSWTLGDAAGLNTLTASVDALDGSPVLFTATATAGAASQIAITGGDDLTGPVATTLGTAHEVRITDATGNAVAGVTVTWSALGGGSLAPASSVTDADGRAATVRTLGPTAGAQGTQASATLAGGLASVTFDITATVGGATQLTLVDGDAQVDTVGATLATPLAVLVRDALNNPVEGVLITWTVLAGGGAVTPGTSLTDASGGATTSWRLGTTRTATDSTQIVRASGVAAPLTFVALARPGAVSATQTLVSVAPASVAASRTTPATVTVTARDGFGNPVADVPVTITATGSGNTIVQPAGVTSATGVATGSVGATVTGARTIAATVNGVQATASPTLTVVAAPAAALLFLDAPANAVAGDDLTPSPSVGVVDSLGNRNFTFTGAVTLGLGVNPNAGALSGTLSRNAVAGVATFTGVAIDRAGSGYQLSASGVDLVGAQSAAISVSAGAISAATSTVSVDPGSIVAGSGTSTITVTARDDHGNSIAGATVVLSASGSDNSLTQPVALTDANGVATGSFGATSLGNRTISATIGGLGVTQTAVVSVVAGAVSPTLSTITGIPSTLVAGVETSNVTVTARDDLGNVIAGATVVIAATGSGNTITQPLGPTNAAGVAQGTFVSTVAEPKTLSATVNGVPLATGATVTVNPGAVSASRSLVAATPDSIVADEGLSTITVTARDANDNPIGGASVVLAASGAGNALTQPAGPTAASGVATGSLGSTAVGDKTVTATINGIAITPSALVRVFPAGVSASQSGVELADASIVAGDSTTITVIARDANGNTVGGAAVLLASDGVGDVLTQPTAVTDGDGVATGRVLATSAGPRTISAVIAGVPVTQTVALAVTPSVPDADESSLSVVPTSIVADGTAAAIAVTVRDEFGNAVPGVTVAVAASGSGNAIAQPSAVTDAAGVATGSISATITGDREISATADGLALADTVTLSVTPAAVSATQSSVTVDPASLTAGAGSSTVTVVARDANGNVVPGLAVTFAVSGGGNALTQPAAVTDGTGAATGSLASTGAGTKTVTATIAGVVVTQTASLTVTPAAISEAMSSVAVSTGTISAGVGSTTITVTVRDAFGNPIPGVAVELAATGSDNTLTQPPAVTDASGVATGTFGSTSSESKTISATADGIAITQTASVNVVPDAASASSSLVVASVNTLVAGTDTATITITARDASSNPVPGVAVTFEANGSGVAFEQPAAVTDTTGVTTGRVSGTVVGARTVTALLNGVPATTTLAFTISPAPVSGDSTLVVIAPQSIVAGAATAEVTITARDAFGNAVPGVTVGLSATGASAVLTQPAAVTDAAGVTTGGIAATLVGDKIVSATVNGDGVTMTDTLSVTPATVSAAQSTIEAAPGAITAGGAASTITVTARDAFGNVVPGLGVALNADGANNTIVQPAAVTNASGEATGTLASTTAGVRTVGASVAGTPIAATTTVTVNPGAVSASLSTIGANPSSVVAGGAPSTITVQVRDLFGNPVPGATVLLVASGSNNTVVQPAATDADGLTSGTLASITAQTKSVQAIANGVTLASGVDVTVTAGAVDADNSALSVTPGALTAGAGSSIITVTARDANDNLIPDAEVVLFATGSGNLLTQPSGNTGVDGMATGALSSTGAGVKSVTATVAGILLTDNPTVTVSAAAIDGAQSALTIDPSSIVADGATASTATITVRDAFGNPIQGATVVVSAAPSTGTTVNGPLATTDALGVTTADVFSTVAGDKTISATASGVSITGTQSLTVTPGAVSGSQSMIGAGSASIVAGSGTSTVTVIARDAEGNPVPDAAVTLGATGTGNVFAPAATGTTDANGEFAADFSSTATGAKVITASIGGTAVSGSADVTVTPAAVSAAQSLVSATPTTLVAGTDTSLVTVTVRDGFDNPIPGVAVTFGASGTGNTLFDPVSTTDASGVATGRFTSSIAGTKTLTATAGATAITQSVDFTITAAAVSADESSLSVGTAQITAGTAGATDSAAVTVTARDEFGNPIGGASVQVLVTGGTDNFASAAGLSDADGVFVGYVRSTSAGPKTISATVAGVTVVETGAVTVVPAAISAAASTVEVSTPTLFAGSGSAIVTVTVLDAFGNPISGATVVVNASGSSNLITGPGATTDALGVATATFSSTVSELKTVSATANSLLLTQQPTIDVVPGEISAAQSEVIASVGSIVAGSGSSTITVTARDANGNPVPGVAATIVSPDADVTFTQPVGVTDADGIAVGVIGATLVGTKRISAELNGVAVVDTVDVAVTPAAVSLATSTITANPTGMTTDQSSTVTVQLRDEFGNALTSSGGTVALVDDIGSALVVTDHDDGTYTASFTSGALGTAVISGTLNGEALDDTAGVVVTVGAAAASTTEITALPSTISTDNSSVITVQVRDAAGNDITTGGASVTLATDLGVLSAVADAGNGTYTATLTSEDPGSATVTGTLNDAAITDNTVVTVTAGAVSPTLSTVSVSPNPITAGPATSTVTITARDQFGNPIQGVAASFVASGTDNVLVQPVGTTDAAGVLTGTISSTFAEQKSVTGTAGGVELTTPATLTVNPAVLSASTSTVTAGSPSITAGSGTSLITATVLDEFSNPISGATVDFAASGEANTFAPAASAITDAGGVATTTFSSTQATIKTITATVGATSFSQPASVTVTAAAVDGATSTISADPTTIEAGVESSTITVTALDEFLNPVPGVPVIVSATGTGNDITGSGANTNAAGVVTVTLESTDAGLKTITASADDVSLVNDVDVTVAPADPSGSMSSIALDPASITASAGGSTSTITATARDANGNAIPGATVVISATGTGNTLTQADSTTDVDGEVTATFSSTVAESKTISALINGTVAITPTATLTVGVGAVDADASELTVSDASIVASAGSATSTITATIRDVHDNPIGGVTVSFLADGAATGLSAASAQTDGAGVASVTFSSTATGVRSITASADAVPLTDAPTIGVTPAAFSAANSTVDVAPSSIVAGTGSSAITVTVRDIFGNAIPGVDVDLAAVGGTYVLTQPAAVTDATGVATGSLSSTEAGVKTVSATADAAEITQTQDVTVTAGDVSVSVSTLTVSAPSIEASGGGNTSTITATILDAHGNPISGATVDFLVDSGTTGLSAANAVTDLAGVAQVTYSSTLAGPRTVTASVDAAQLVDEPTVQVTPAAASLATSQITASDESITSDETSTITVRLRDEFGNDLTETAGTVTLLATPGGALDVTPVGDGTYTATFDGTTATAVTITGQLDDNDIEDDVVVTVGVGAVSAALSTLTADPSSIVAGGAAATILVTARDGAGNAIANVPVVLDFTGDAGVLTQPSGNTDGVGEASGSFAATIAGDRTISATVDDVAITATAVVSVTPAAADPTETLITAAAPSFTAGGSTTITVQVRDEFGNVVSSTSDEIVLDGNIGSFGTVTPTGPGTYEATFSSDSADVALITGTLNEVAITDGVTVTVNAGAAITLVFSVEPTSTAPDADIVPAVVVRAVDAFNNTDPTFAGDIALTLADGDNGVAELTGGGAIAAIAGVATFANLQVTLPGTGFTLRADSAGFAQAISILFNITP